MPSDLQTSQLFVYNPEKSQRRAICCTSEPFFILGEVKDSTPSGEKILELIKETFLDGLHKPHPLNGTESRPAPAESVLERTLELVNKKLVEELSKGDELELLKKINIIVALVQNEHIYFAQVGKAKAFLIHKDKIVNILTKESETPPNPLKFFSHVINGHLEEKDVLIFCTENFLDYFSLDRLKNTLTNFSLVRACEHLQNLLIDVKDEVTLGAIMIKNTTAEAEKEAEEAIGPSTRIEVEAPAPAPVSQLTVRREKRPSIRLKLSEFWHNFLDKFKKIKMPQVKLPPRLDSLAFKFKNYFKSLVLPSKILFIIILVLAVLLAQTIITLVVREVKQRETRRYIELVEEIQEKQNAIASALIYGDKSKAKTLLDETGLLLKDLSTNSPERQKTYKLLTEESQKHIRKVYNISQIEPKFLADFKTLDGNIKIGGILQLNKTIYGFNPINNSIYQLKLNEEPKAEIVSQTSKNIGHLQHGAILEKNLIFCHDGQGLARFDIAKNTLTPLELTTSRTNYNIKGMFGYGGRLYVLEQNQGQILKYSATLEGFGKEENWIKDENFKITNGQSLAIDGFIYVLDRTRILKFHKGDRVDFNLEPIRPLLQEPSKIFTESYLSHLYVLEPAGNRLIIFDKEGNLKQQFVAENLNNLKDFTVAKDETRAYLLNDTQIFEIPLAD
jgi:hypothetical protein